MGTTNFQRKGINVYCWNNILAICMNMLYFNIHKYTCEHICNHRCFNIHCKSNALSTNIKLNIRINTLYEKNTYCIIELPRQLLKVHNIYENTTVSLWELSLRKVYIERYNHSLDISMSPVKINIFFEPIVKNQSLDFTIQSVHCASYTLLFNGPTSICLNAHCQQPIFTEAWVVIGTNHHAEFITAVSLCCCKRCAVEFSMHCGMIINVDWHCIT